MNDIEAILSDRRNEISELIEELLVEEQANLKIKPTFATRKASLFLILYNLIESIMFASFELLFDEISYNCHDFNHLIPKVQTQFKKYDKHNNISENDLLIIGLEKYSGRVTLFSGNVDARSIRIILSDWGIITDFHVSKEEKLRDIKEFRNTLAHGEKAFKEVGREYTMKEMRKYSFAVFNYLFAVVGNFNDYIKYKHYMTN